ncbi:Olfactory marker protein [Channa argus]|uniref:Olfactory marker protein n=1 Tax=Channa argus TaxID=215402 RepID=A0A6G1QTA7_CHAAH|nr:Olfactory marker protein [Channa argus]
MHTVQSLQTGAVSTSYWIERKCKRFFGHSCQSNPALQLVSTSQPAEVCCPSMSTELELPFLPDTQLTEVMRLRVQSLQQRGQKRQEGERLLGPNEAVYRLDFSKQTLQFSHWTVRLAQPGHLTITATSQLWTPDLTNLMTRQLLEPAGIFWRSPGDARDAPIQCIEADAYEFGERIAELATVRKVMYFLFGFAEGCSPETVDCSITFIVDG